MNPLHTHFPPRLDGDAIDVAPLLEQGLRQAPGRVVFVFEGQAVTCGELREHIDRLRAWLASRGLRQGDRVAVMLPNSSGHIALIYALILSGLVWVPVNTRLRAAGLQYLLRHAGPRLLVAEDEYAEAIEQARQDGVPLASGTDIDAVAARADVAPAALPPVRIRHADTLCIIYTSGTTGAPKGVLFTHRMMRIASEATLRVANAKAGDRLFVWEPLCHIGGAQMLMVPFLEPVQLHVVERFSASRFWAQWRDAGATHLHYLGGILDILAQAPQPPQSYIRTAWGAGVAARSWDAIRQRLGCEIRECYGMTECASFATLNASGKPGSIGRPLPWLRLELLGQDGLPVAPGEAGEIVLSSEIEGAFLPGYLDNPEASRRALRDGRLHTGDSARQDADGDYFFVGRATDSMRVRGENVSAWEVERVFIDHPAIQACAAVGVAGDVGEQEILLYVQFVDGPPVGWTELVDWARPRLASYQLPRYFRQTPGFELTPSERIRKHLLARDAQGAWRRA
ncbi:class I adenylate-forming enzyme family protein [Achromobacter sp. AONIH1]|uniref:class I adenylate-forming enzyme family protein n=1 Tax=Achromobacter sp. AONIH1 TaxID=1758194 RepID=UPI000CD12250|nr:AMP-binding protein [Achromobacter sp. AONIH1]AUT45399.1 AMP-dependent synthetase [Achromobacter sp. AONIH1]